MNHEVEQAQSRVRFDWGPAGAHAVARDVDVAVVVDVLSFTTALTVAADAGIAVVPCPWDATPAELVRCAVERSAVLATSRTQARPGQISLSPASVRRAAGIERVLLPSPNGSNIAAHLAGMALRVVGGCLRNARAVARSIVDAHDPAVVRVAVIAGGERRLDGTLRPAVEDLWGAGAIIAGLAAAGCAELSPEAGAAAAAYAGVAGDELRALLTCVSGRELTASGFVEDVQIAAEVDASALVPMLVDGLFTPA